MDKIENVDEYYKKLIEGKKVIFVGPATYLKEQKKGKWIDNEFDLVVRTNGSSFLVDRIAFQEDYGKRMDILYCNVQFHREMGPLPLQEWKNKFGLKLVNFKLLQDRYKEMYSDIVPVRSIKNMVRILQKQVPSVLMGPILIHDILQFKPKLLYFTGIDFYINKPDEFIPGDYREYYPGYLPPKIEKKANKDNIGLIDRHEQYSNCRIMFDLYRSGQIKADEEEVGFMEKIIRNPRYYSVTGKLERVRNKNLKKQLKKEII